jgi:hypothetical protein
MNERARYLDEREHKIRQELEDSRNEVKLPVRVKILPSLPQQISYSTWDLFLQK